MKKLIVFLFLFCLFLYFCPSLWPPARGRGLIQPLARLLPGSFFGRLLPKASPNANSPLDAKQIVKPFAVPILLYHFVENVADENDTLRRAMAVTPFLFGEQLKALKKEGYRSVGFSNLARAYRGEESLPEKAVIITFDDGHRDLHDNALPLLVKYDFKATIFVITGRLDREDFLLEGQLREMVKSGYIEVGSHTVSHEYLGVIDKWAREEVFRSKEFLEDNLAVKVEAFSYPGGSRNVRVESLVKEAGYRAAVGTTAGLATEKSNPYELPRLRVGNLSGRGLLGMIENYRRRQPGTEGAAPPAT